MINKVIIMGRLCADPEFRQTNSGIPVCRIRLAVNRPYKKDQEQQADFINVTCWRTTAEFVARFFSKGKMIIVEGSLLNNDYTDQNGVKHYSMDVLAQNVAFGESKGSHDDSDPRTATQASGSVDAGYNSPVNTQSPQNAPLNDLGDISEFEEILSDGDVPF